MKVIIIDNNATFNKKNNTIKECKASLTDLEKEKLNILMNEYNDTLNEKRHIDIKNGTSLVIIITIFIAIFFNDNIYNYSNEDFTSIFLIQIFFLSFIFYMSVFLKIHKPEKSESIYEPKYIKWISTFFKVHKQKNQRAYMNRNIYRI